ncbi:MAG: hypothetical protein Q7R87_04115 [Nanoarchaeota archaeon]|nr:hypothetical protein [Nanoarchaeota archaeon]
MEDKVNLKEDRIRAITKLYYSNPKVQQVLMEFAVNRETVPRYFEGFGKRPDTIQYPSDIINLVNKGATSFHASEEIWNDPLSLNTDLSEKEYNDIRKGWDLLIDIDSPYLDVSRIAAKVLLEALEYHGIKNYGIKFSGSKGFHIIVGGKAFPKEYEGEKMKDKFPEWPRAIVEYLFDFIKKRFRSEVGKVMTINREEKNFEDVMECIRCESQAIKAEIIFYKCKVCGSESRLKEWKSEKITRRCGMKGCNGVLEKINKEEYWYCPNCKDSDNNKWPLSNDKSPEDFQISRKEKADEVADFDLVLVAPRHLFRMPYSLHEKTSLASVVLTKEELDSFNPKDADPMKINIRNFLPSNFENEAGRLLKDALHWKKSKVEEEEKLNVNRFAGKSFEKDKKDKEYEEFKFENVNEKDFPEPIKKLLKGLEDGKKRGLFILITFLRCIQYTPEQINNLCRAWNKRNAVPLKEGYIKSQIEWHLKQKRKILPPNYTNDSFYKDLMLLDKKPETKNPLVDMIRNVRNRR